MTIAVAAAAVFLLVLAAGLVRNALRPAPVVVTRVVPPIDPGAYQPYTHESAPVLYAFWGDAMMAAINELKRGAAQVVAGDHRCDTPAYTDLHRSSNPNRLVILVTCRNQWSTPIEDWKIREGLRDAEAAQLAAKTTP